MLFVQVGKQYKMKNSEKQPLQMFSKELFLKIFPKYCQENTCVGVFLNKVASLKVCIFIEKETPTQLFSCKYCEILKNSSFLEHLTTLGKNLIFFIFLVPLLCFPT